MLPGFAERLRQELEQAPLKQERHSPLKGIYMCVCVLFLFVSILTCMLMAAYNDSPGRSVPPETFSLCQQSITLDRWYVLVSSGDLL